MAFSGIPVDDDAQPGVRLDAINRIDHDALVVEFHGRQADDAVFTHQRLLRFGIHIDE